WRRVNLGDFLRGCCIGFIHNSVFGMLDAFEFGIAAILFGPYFDQGRNFGAGGHMRGRLAPSAVKTIVQHVAVPPELRCAVCTTGHGGLSRLVGTCLSAFRCGHVPSAVWRPPLLGCFWRWLRGSFRQQRFLWSWFRDWFWRRL